jgi:hypothetical protein
MADITSNTRLPLPMVLAFIGTVAAGAVAWGGTTVEVSKKVDAKEAREIARDEMRNNPENAELKAEVKAMQKAQEETLQQVREINQFLRANR